MGIEEEKKTLNELVEMLNEDEITELVRFISRRHLNCISKALCAEAKEIEDRLAGPYDIHDAWQDR